MNLKTKNLNICISIFILVLVFLAPTTRAAKIDDLKEEISSHNSEIKKLEQEINQYRNDLTKVRNKSNTLAEEIRRIDTTRQKLAADISLTSKQIDTTNLTLEKISIEIKNNEKKIKENQEAIAETMRRINNIESSSVVEILLSHNTLSDFLNETSALEQLQSETQNQLNNLNNAQDTLAEKISEKEKENKELSTLKNRIESQKIIVDENRKEQGALLAATKNEESSYQALLNDRLAKKEQLESEVRRIEEQIKIEINPNTLPSTGTGVLGNPLSSIKITQYFGNTAFATQNPQIYSGSGHNGIDLAASPGTPVFASESGRVKGVDDTDRVCPGASYGKWVLIEHSNGLSTLYAHLSHVAVHEGQIVNRGDEIAYTGNSGYTTGPHLHFEVLVSKATRVTDGITELKSKSCAGAVYRIPLSGFNGKLNPLSYL